MTADDKVWIVDDDRSIRWVLEKALMTEGFQATAFEDAQHLLSKLARETPHAIVTDIRMPGIDGLTLLSKIRMEHPDIPVIVISAFIDKGGLSEADGYLRKPIELGDLLQVVGRFCG